MEYNFAKKQARRIGRNIIVSRLILIGLLAGLAYMFMPNPLNLYGNYAGFKDAAQLPGLLDSKLEFVETEAENFFDTGFVLSEDGKDKYYYYAFWSGDQLVLTRTGLDYTEGEYANMPVQGKLVKPSRSEQELFDGVTQDIAEILEIEPADARSLLAPYLLYKDFNPLPQQIVMVVGALVALLALFRIFQAISGMVNYRTTKSFKALAKGPNSDADWVNDEVSAELAQDRVQFDTKSLKITNRWIISQSNSSFSVWPKKDAVWVYRTVTQHRTNGIPTGKTHTVNVCMAGKDTASVSARNQAGAEQIVEQLERCGLQAVFGYSGELEALYNGDHDAFIALAREPRMQTPMPIAE